MWESLSDLVDETVSELGVLCDKYPHSNFGDFFDSEELHKRESIRKAERKAIARIARHFKKYPEQLDRWAELNK